ncbi:MAG: PrsW family intramembrane metalloprotease [Pseudoclavibacter sp.]|nr:PrsW family intramembrane metalloprotease [Pseudoclavibacter sp.]
MTQPAPERRTIDIRVPRIWWWVLAVVVFLALIVAGWLLVTLRADAVIMAFPALVPFGIVLAGVWWLDRWEPEPRLLMLLAVLYGAGASILGTLLTGNFMLRVTSEILATRGEVNGFAAVVQGPIIEEAIKCLGIVLLLLIARREFNGPVDGFIYAALIGAGFAFTENIVYFAGHGGTELEFVRLLVVRGILSPFAHVLFTGLAGMALGWAARRGGTGRISIAFLLGLLAAIVAHAFWNGGSVVVVPLLGLDPREPVGWVVFYTLTQVPMFLLLAWLLLRLVDQDRTMTRRRLEEYREAGWFTPNEIEVITDWDARVRALRWSRTFGPRAEQAMSGFIQASVRLAFAREHARIDKTDPDRRTVERVLLEEVRARRAEVQEALAAAPGARG